VDQHPETQLYDLRQMAAQRGFEIVEEYTDRISGVKARRPGLDELMRDARRGRFDVVLVWASDRIARSVRHFLEVLDEMNRLNIEFISFREQIDTGGPLAGPSSSSSGRLPNSNATLLSSGSAPACGAPASKDVT
jgi:DNA invertase Pin-like site-specific DNA recombinase